MQRFQTAKTLLTILMYVGWFFVALCAVAGILCAVAGIIAMDQVGLMAIIGAGLLSIFGFLVIATAQMGLAQIAIAENTGMMLEIMRGQNPLEPQAGYANKTKTTPNPVNVVGEKSVGETIKTYKGYKIKKAQDGVEVDGEQFQNLLFAEKWINQNPK